jgi:catechol 2,3-dioxygenase-like lactoylglutathione lyase family enzyme
VISKLSHFSIYVLDQDSAYDFYVNKLGFEVKTDAKMDNGFRWLTVAPKEQGDSEMEIALMATQGPGAEREHMDAMRDLIKKGAFGVGVFYTADCRKTYEELRAKGVKFRSEPEEQFYGIECIVEDDSGNWFSMTQPKVH